MWLELLEFCLFSFLIIQFVRLVLADADLTLLWKEKFGKKPAVLRGDVVWISGASSGIGEYLAYELAKAGCKLILSARREDQLDRVKQTCISQGWTKEDDILVLPLDLLAIDTHAAAVENVHSKFSKIDILVNNSGQAHISLAENTELAVHRHIMEINYFGTLSLTKAVLPHMLKRKRGHIVVTSSTAGKSPSIGQSGYCGSKFALQGWFDTLRLESSMDNIYVTMMCPGPVQSDIGLHLLTGTSGENWDAVSLKEKTKQVKVMSTERCASLMAIGIANKLDEIWICNNPILTVIYLSQYIPSLGKLVWTFLAGKIIQQLGLRKK